MIPARTSRLLRGAAILIVIASHYAGWMYVEPVHPLAQARIATWGPPGVDIFFLLSGYGLYKSAARGEGAGRGGAQKKSGVTAGFVVRRLLAAVVPYLLVVGLINCFAHVWAQAAVDGTLLQAVWAYVTAADYWYMQVLFVFYAAFFLCFRLGGLLRVPLLAAAVVGYTVWLFQTGHADFWELSNPAFLIGVLAAGAERRWPEAVKRVALRWALLAVGLSGMLIAYAGMERNGGSGVPESFGWELVMNVFFALAVLAAAWLLPVVRQGRALAALGEASLFIYLLHAALFWALIFRLEALFSSYARAAAAAGLVTLLFGTAAGLAYSRLTGLLLKKFG